MPKLKKLFFPHLLESSFSYNIYIKKNFPKDEERKAYPDLTDEEILETVGRGLTAYSVRFNNAIAKWNDELLEAAKNPRKKDQKEFSSQGPFVANNIEQPPPNPTRFTVLNYQDIMSMPDPVYMVDGLIIENSFTFIAGDPGAGKSFAAMSLMMGVANKKPTWMGRNVKKHGAVIYISTEGNNDMKFRLKAWESEYGRLKEDPPIHLIPDQMNLLVEQDVDDLIATIESKIKEIGQKVELIVFDTVSNNIPGADENLQKDVTLFVRACTKIKIKFSHQTLFHGCKLYVEIEFRQIEVRGEHLSNAVVLPLEWEGTRLIEPFDIVEIKQPGELLLGARSCP